MNEKKLDDHLTTIVQSVVSDIGVPVNQASIDVLKYVSGLNKSTATNIHAYVRSSKGPLENRERLKDIKGIGTRTYEQCVGFLRVPESINILDNTNIHPESYQLARAVMELVGCSSTLLSASDVEKLNKMNEMQRTALAARYKVPSSRVTEIIHFLTKPGAMSDPRRHSPPITMREGPLKLSNIKIGAMLNGTVRNVTSFGAFVDIGVGTDGLLHSSQMNHGSSSGRRMGAGMTLKVVVLEVDIQRKRISLGCEGGGSGGSSGGSSGRKRSEGSVGMKRKRGEQESSRGRGGGGRGGRIKNSKRRTK